MSIEDAKITKLTKKLSISLDEGKPVLLFVPNPDKPEHHHIELDKEAAYQLLVWLEDTKLDWS